MLRKIKREVASHPAAMSLLAGVMVIGLANSAGAFASRDYEEDDAGSCVYSLQLQKSVSIQREYLVRVEEATGRLSQERTAVEEMYGNIVPASYRGNEEQTGMLSIIIGSGSSGGSTAQVAANPTLDRLSADCIACHDGVTASNIGIKLRDQPYGRRSQVDSFTNDHAIGMNYNRYVAADSSFKPVGTTTRMIFVNGRVGCLTCHDPLNPERGHLVMSDSESALCKTCHDK